MTAKDVNALIKQISESPFEDFQFTSHGVTVVCDYEHSGYQGLTDYGVLFPTDEDGEKYFSVAFKMFK